MTASASPPPRSPSKTPAADRSRALRDAAGATHPGIRTFPRRGGTTLSRHLLRTLKYRHYVTITLNGEPTDLAGPLTVSELLTHLQIDARRVAVELNLVVLKRATFDTAVVEDGDEVEIVNFVGGG